MLVRNAPVSIGGIDRVTFGCAGTQAGKCKARYPSTGASLADGGEIIFSVQARNRTMLVHTARTTKKDAVEADTKIPVCIDRSPEVRIKGLQYCASVSHGTLD
jgi:hypothetical protein